MALRKRLKEEIEIVELFLVMDSLRNWFMRGTASGRQIKPERLWTCGDGLKDTDCMAKELALAS